MNLGERQSDVPSEPAPRDNGPYGDAHVWSPIAKYLAQLVSPVSRTSMAAGLRLVGRYIAPDLVASSPEHAAALRRHLVERSGLAVGTVNRALAAVRGVARVGASIGVIDRATADAIQRVARCVREVPAVVPAIDTLMTARLDSLVPRYDSTTRARMHRVLIALLRRGVGPHAIVRVDLADYDPTTPSLVLRGAGRRARRVMLDGPTRMLIDDWLQVRGLHAGALLVGVHRTGRPLRRRLHPGSVRDVLRRRCAMCGIRPAFRPGDLRRRALATLVERHGHHDARLIVGLRRRRSLPVPAPTGGVPRWRRS